MWLLVALFRRTKETVCRERRVLKLDTPFKKSFKFAELVKSNFFLWCCRVQLSDDSNSICVHLVLMRADWFSSSLVSRRQTTIEFVLGGKYDIV